MFIATDAFAYFNDNFAIDFSYSGPTEITDSQMALYINGTLFDSERGFLVPGTSIVDIKVDKGSKD